MVSQHRWLAGVFLSVISVRTETRFKKTPLHYPPRTESTSLPILPLSWKNFLAALGGIR